MCAQLDYVVRNVRQHRYGRSDLFPTGPGLAGECLARVAPQINYSMQLLQGQNGLYRPDGTPVIRTHAWAGPTSKCAGRSFSCATNYNGVWRRRAMFHTNCSVHGVGWKGHSGRFWRAGPAP